MQPACSDSPLSSSSSEEWACTYDSDAGVMEAVCRLYDLRKSNVELLATLSKAQECLQARLSEQFEESRAPAEDCDPNVARANDSGQPQRRTL
jgi:hypothetical protein